MIRSLIAAIGIAALGVATPLAAQGNYAESGWRASTDEEKDLREAFEDAQDDWNSRRDGENERYDCVMRWGAWSVIGRMFDDDMIPAISGELMHSYADAQMSHHLSTLIAAEGGNAERVGEKLAYAAVRFAERPENESLETVMEALGKCYVQPLSWSINPNYRLTGPRLFQMLGDQSAYDGFPVWVNSNNARAQFDQYIMDKDFVAAANLGARLHTANDKTTVMWNEVLRASLLSIESGRGLALSDTLLSALSEVWWPRYRRDWASNLLRQKRGLPTGQANRPPLYDPGEEPGWAKQERERYLNGETNYTPCNRWNTYGC